MTLATLPGFGDAETWPACAGHPNDPRASSLTPEELARARAALRATIRAELRHALIRKHHVHWGIGDRPELAADAIHGCGLGDENATEAWLGLHSAIANGASDAEVARLARAHHVTCFELCTDDLTECALDGRRITFPVRGGR